jgi:molybdopterin molybdotransferase
MPQLPVFDLLTVDQAIAILDAAPVRSRLVSFPLIDAMGLRLASPIIADRDYPPFDKALMDGYAVRSSDVTSPGVDLVVIDTIAAGRSGTISVGPGQAAATMTGAPIPPGADALVPVEQTTRLGNTIRINAIAKPGQAIARRGSDTVAGRLLLESGTRLGPAQIAVAASVGAATVSVHARPRVAVLSTGDELVEINQIPAGPQIRNANSHMMVALLRQLGCEVVQVSHVRDDMTAVLKTIQANLHHDALFVTGGMSVGEFDFVPKALVQLGAGLEISKLAIKPGKPFVYTRLGSDGSCHIFGLPGNPVSAFVCTLRLAARIISRLAGGPPDAEIRQARLTTELPANGPREFYQPAIVDGSSVSPLSIAGSADVFTLARGNALLIRPANAAPASVGEMVNVLVFQLAWSL